MTPRTEAGQTLAEYAVLLGVITVVIITAIATLSSTISDRIDGIASLLP